MASMCVRYAEGFTTDSKAVAVLYVYRVDEGRVITYASPTTGCASGYALVDNADYIRFNTAATTQAAPVNWPEIFNLSVSDGATLSVAILAVWISAFKFKALWRALNPDGEKE